MVETTENGDEGRNLPYPCAGICSPPKGEIAARSRAAAGLRPRPLGVLIGRFSSASVCMHKESSRTVETTENGVDWEAGCKQRYGRSRERVGGSVPLHATNSRA